MGDTTSFEIDSTTHLRWLAAQQDELVAFASAAVDPSGGFFWLDSFGNPNPDKPRQLYAVARLVHCFSIEHLLGRPGASEIARHGVEVLATRFIDREHGGFFASVPTGVDTGSTRKEAYGHAFALLAGVGAKRAGIVGAEEIVDWARTTLDNHFWDAGEGASRESFDRSFTESEDYRGQNSNMHLTESYLAAYEATGEEVFIDRAESIAQRIVRSAAAAHDGRIPEHFTARWEVASAYNRDRPDDPFRPFGTLVGHSFEWSRLLLQLRALRPSAAWTLEAAEHIFHRAIADGWDAHIGGFVYSVDERGVPVNRSRMHWAAAEAVGAAYWLYRATGKQEYREWYSTAWEWIDRHLIDREGGSWWHELDSNNRPASTTWDGKPDLYHAWQATLYARVDGTLGLGEAAARGRIAR